MNSTLVHPYNEYPLSSDTDFLGQERSYHSSTTPRSSNDYLHSFRNSGPASGSSLSSAAVPINSGLKYSSQSLFHESPFHSTASPLLSPPDSLSGSVSGGGSAIPSIAYSTLPKLCPSNVSSTEQYSAAPASFLHPWSDSGMSELHRHRVQTLHPATLSPPLTYNAGNSMPGLNHTFPRSITEPHHLAYYTNRPALPHYSTAASDLGKYASHPPIYRSEPYSTIPLQYPDMTATPSRSQRPEGPPFQKTDVILPLVTAQNHSVMPDIDANIQKGFFQVDGKWTCYRRNYFTVSCSFSVKNQPMDGVYYIQRQNQLEPITKFAVSISARTATVNNQDSEVRGLVQHTPKRDKATESIPGKQVIQPKTASSMSTMNGLGINGHGYPGSHHMPNGAMGHFDGFGSSQHSTPPCQYTFERIQFQKATANNGKRRAQQQYFHVVVELSAEIGTTGSDRWVTIAKKQSDQMVVRGRSPGHYKDGVRRDSAGSMDPDRGSGSGGDVAGRGHSNMSSGFGGHSRPSNMDWTPSNANEHLYGRTAYRNAGLSYSPESASPTTCFTTTPQESESDAPEDGGTSPGQMYRRDSLAQDYPYRRSSAGMSAHASELFDASRKQPFEDDNFSYDSAYSSRNSVAQRFTDSSADFSMLTLPKAVCAS